MGNQLTLTQAALKYGYTSSRALRAAIDEKQLKAERVGSVWIVTDKAMLAYMNGTRPDAKRPGRPRRRPDQSQESS